MDSSSGWLRDITKACQLQKKETFILAIAPSNNGIIQGESGYLVIYDILVTYCQRVIESYCE